jgi:putative ABC transport system ATP-binding protein
MHASSPVVAIRDLVKSYRRGDQVVPVLTGITFDIAAGEFVALMGPSGSGKTTLLNLIGGLDTPSAGSIRIGGEEIVGLQGGALSRWRARHVGFVFQTFNLIPVLDAFGNVELPLLLTRLGKAQRRTHVEAALNLVGLGDRMRHYPRQLSGGQEQRVAIARALVSDPQLLLADEPTGDLDRHTSDEIMQLVRRLAKEFGKTVLMVTHDPLAAALADVVLHLDKGVLVEAQSGTAAS